MVNFGPLAPEIVSLVWGTLQISMGFASWQRYCTACSSGRQPNFATLNRGRHLCLAGRPSRWALAHISSCILLQTSLYECAIFHFIVSRIFTSTSALLAYNIRLQFFRKRKDRRRDCSLFGSCDWVSSCLTSHSTHNRSLRELLPYTTVRCWSENT